MLTNIITVTNVITQRSGSFNWPDSIAFSIGAIALFGFLSIIVWVSNK